MNFFPASLRKAVKKVIFLMAVQGKELVIQKKKKFLQDLFLFVEKVPTGKLEGGGVRP